MGRLFEPFFTTKEKGRGTGFGLSTVYGIVKQCEGDIAVHSQPGAGATFEIFLPRAVAALMLEPSAADAEKPLGGNETILVVEDEAPLRQVVKRLLESVGYTVLTAPNGEEALETFALHADTIRLDFVRRGHAQAGWRRARLAAAPPPPGRQGGVHVGLFGRRRRSG